MLLIFYTNATKTTALVDDTRYSCAAANDHGVAHMCNDAKNFNKNEYYKELQCNMYSYRYRYIKKIVLLAL